MGALAARVSLRRSADSITPSFPSRMCVSAASQQRNFSSTGGILRRSQPLLDDDDGDDDKPRFKNVGFGKEMKKWYHERDKMQKSIDDAYATYDECYARATRSMGLSFTDYEKHKDMRKRKNPCPHQIR